MAKALPLITIAPNQDVVTNSPIMIHIRLAELLHFSQEISDPKRIVELHAMRIAAKRLRYTLEIFQPYLTPYDTSNIYVDKCLNPTKKIQELIGEVHDFDVRILRIKEYCRRQKANSEYIVGLKRLIENETIKRTKLYNGFLIFWNEIKDEYQRDMIETILGSSIRSLNHVKREDNLEAKPRRVKAS